MSEIVIELVNSVAWRLEPGRAEERLGDATALVRWLVAHEVITPELAGRLHAEIADDPDRAERIGAEVRALRELTYRVLHPLVTGGRPGADDVDALRGRMIDALATASLTSLVPLRWEIALRELADTGPAMALETWRLLQFADLGRLRQCADGTCGWLFLDHSKNRSRRWCSSANCGNRARARRHYRRTS